MEHQHVNGNVAALFPEFPELICSQNLGIALHVSIKYLPENLLYPIQELSKHFPRKGAFVVSDQNSLQQVTIDGHARYVWNVQFVPEPTIAVDMFCTVTNKESFASPSEFGGQSRQSTVPYMISIHYHPDRITSAFRALGYILGVTRAIHRIVTPESCSSEAVELMQDPLLYDAADNVLLVPALAHQLLFNHSEKCHFETVGTMIDCSRNGVLNLNIIKYFCRTLALMGFNMLQLYTEDSYEIQNEPFFGYLRGKYTQSELQQIDDYAYRFGIEVIPCIQTLGHLGQVLQWPRFLPMRDTSEVLLAESSSTYEMLDKMITHITSPFRSKRIHLGMDEAHGVGYGRYYMLYGQQNGKDPNQIFIEHLQKLNKICLDKGLQPMIWSDMLFNLSRATLGENNEHAESSHASVKGIPPNVDLVYWDYYHVSESSYTSRIAIHSKFRDRPPWVAAGSWTWSRFWTALPFTFLTCRANIDACKSHKGNVKHVFITVWGDEGNEMDIFSTLPAWQYYADLAYTPNKDVDPILLKAKFSGITGASFDDYVTASKLDDLFSTLPELDDRIHFAPNTSKWLLWEEPMLGFVNPTILSMGIDVEAHYTNLANQLRTLVNKSQTHKLPGARHGQSDYPLNSRLVFPYLIAKALSIKPTLRHKFHLAYTQHDWKTFRGLADDLDELRETCTLLWSYHRKMWMKTYKPFGWETLELRYGGLLARLATMSYRVRRFMEHLDAGGQVGVPLNPDVGQMDIQDILSHSKTPEISTKNGTSHTDALDPGQFSADDEPSTYSFVTELPELAVPLETVFSSPNQILDYHRVSRPTYC